MRAPPQVSAILRTPNLFGGRGGLKGALASAAPALLFGLRFSASVCLALVVAFWWQLDEPYWAATSAGVVAQPALGASLRKGRFRAIGTVVGGIAIVLMTAAFPQERVGFLASLTLWGAVCGYLASILPGFVGYAAALAGYSAAIVFAGVVDDPQNVFLLAVFRVTEIGIGIFSAVLVYVLTDFGDARLRLSRAMMELGKGIASGLGATLRAGRETLELRTSRRVLIGRVIALDATIEEAIGEPSQGRYERGHLQEAVNALFIALSSWRAIGNHLRVGSHPATARWMSMVLPAIARLTERDWLGNPRTIRALFENESGRVQQMSAVDVSSLLLKECVARVLRALQVVVDALIAVLEGSGETRARIRNRLYVADYLPGLVNALRVALALVASELIWIATSWPQGPTLITFTAVNAILSARQSEAAFAWAVQFTIGCLIGGLLAWVAKLAILPMVHGGPFSLSMALTLLLLPLGALAAGSWRTTVFVAAATNFMPILALENETVYDAALLFDTTIAVGGGTAIAALFLRLLPPLPLKRRIERLLMLTLRDLRALLASRRQYTQNEWLGLVSARLAAMPYQASLEEQAELLATFSVGEAALALLTARPNSPARDVLDRALACLAEARIAEAHDLFVRFADSQDALPSRNDPKAIDSAVQATVIADALQRHQGFFANAA